MFSFHRQPPPSTAKGIVYFEGTRYGDTELYRYIIAFGVYRRVLITTTYSPSESVSLYRITLHGCCGSFRKRLRKKGQPTGLSGPAPHSPACAVGQNKLAVPFPSSIPTAFWQAPCGTGQQESGRSLPGASRGVPHDIAGRLRRRF